MIEAGDWADNALVRSMPAVVAGITLTLASLLSACSGLDDDESQIDSLGPDRGGDESGAELGRSDHMSAPDQRQSGTPSSGDGDAADSDRDPPEGVEADAGSW